MNPKRAAEFERLKQQAYLTLHELDLLTGDGSIIHDRNMYHHLITLRIKRLEKKGEQILVGDHHIRDFTLSGLEQKLKEVNIWITKIKLRGR